MRQARSAATIKATASNVTMITENGAFQQFKNFILDCNSQTSCNGINMNTLGSESVLNVEVKGFKGYGIQNGGDMGLVQNAYIHGGVSCTEGYNSYSHSVIVNSVITANACPGIIASSSTVIEFNIISANTGASSDGIQISTGSASSGGEMIVNNSIDSNGRDGIRFTAANSADSWDIRNNLITNNTGYGINSTTTNYSVTTFNANYNGFYGNGTAARNQYPVGSNDVTLTGTPYVNTAGGNYALNTTAGAGAAANGAGFPGVFNGISTTGVLNMGAVQSSESISSSAPTGAPIQ